MAGKCCACGGDATGTYRSRDLGTLGVCEDCYRSGRLADWIASSKEEKQKEFKCVQCGKCCLDNPELSATQEDIEMWEDEFRDDILDWVDIFELGEDVDEIPIRTGDLWISPNTGDEVKRCPWLRKLPKKDQYICRINECKPEVCRNFPLTYEHAVKCGCPGWVR